MERIMIALRAVTGLEHPVDGETFKEIQEICQGILKEIEDGEGDAASDLKYHLKFFNENKTMLPVGLTVTGTGLTELRNSLLKLCGERLRKIRIFRVEPWGVEYKDSVGTC